MVFKVLLLGTGKEILNKKEYGFYALVLSSLEQ